MDINLLELYRALLKDLDVGRKTAYYILNRLRNEGIRFCTETLPAFSKHLLHCVEQGFWSSFGTSIALVRGLPCIFRGFLSQIFIYSPRLRLYVVREDADPVSIWVIRQACEYIYKLALPFSEDNLSDYSDRFVQTDSEVLGVGGYDIQFVDSMRKNFETNYPASATLSLNKMANAAHPGPGTFAGCGRDFWRRNFVPVTYPPSGKDLWSGLRLNRKSPRPRVSESCSYSEVLFVPKDSRGPRVIVREPYERLMFQMGWNSTLSRSLEQDTEYRVNTSDQGINRALAESASITRSHATLDLKDASDRVSHAIVRHLFRYTQLGKYLSLFRTSAARLADGRMVVLRKLAGMGSGFTFPTMALVIHLAICTRISQALNKPYRSVMKDVYVYGDDIILPVDWYDLAASALSKVGLAVNSSKSFRRSYFRESCGGDFFRGNDVSPVRLKLASARLTRRGVVITPTDPDFFLLGLERHARELVKKQLYSASAFVYKYLEAKLGPLPFVTESSPILGRLSDRDSVLQSLVDGPTGYAKESLWTILPVKKRVAKVVDRTVRDACPYRHMLRLFGKDSLTTWHRDLFPAGSQADFGVATLPRAVKLVKRKLSGFART